jgi:hypothetical protein
VADREALDALQGDMAAHQAATTGEVAGENNRQLAASVFDRIEHKMAERARKAAPAPAPVSRQVARAEKREIDGKRYTVTRSPEPEGPTHGQAVLKSSKHALWLFERASARLQLLLSKPERGPLGQPSWRERAMAWLALVGGKQPTKRSLAELLQLCDESSAAFGDWKKEREVRLYVGGGMI